MPDLQTNLEKVEKNISKAAPGRLVTLIAVSKGRSVEQIKALYSLGVHDFGENRLQEALPKIKGCEKTCPQIRWHFIGTLQRNKVRQVAGLFDFVHSVDTLEIIGKIAQCQNEFGKKPAVFIQVNISNEQTKHGFSAEKAIDAAAYAINAGLDVTGFMGIAKETTDEKELATEFSVLGRIRREAESTFGKKFLLSAGMSGDFETALKCGSDFLRIGHALFE